MLELKKTYLAKMNYKNLEVDPNDHFVVPGSHLEFGRWCGVAFVAIEQVDR